MLWQSKLSCHLQWKHPTWLTVPAPLPFQFAAAVPGKAVENSPSAWALVPVWESWRNLLAPGFSLTELIVAAIMEVNQQMKDPLSLSLSFTSSVSVVLPFK